MSASVLVNNLKNYLKVGTRPNVTSPVPTTSPKAAALGAAPWVVNHSPTGRFQVELPGKIKEEVVTLAGKPTSSMLKFHRGGFFYCAVCRDFTALNREGAAAVAAGEEHQALSHDDFRKEREDQINLGGHAGVQFEILYRSGMTCIRQIAVVDERLYRVDIGFMAKNHTESEVNQACDRFFDSFKII